MRATYLFFAVVWLSLCVVHSFTTAQDDDEPKATRPPITRAARPTFSDREVETLFFRDIFAQGLVGDRPADFGRFGTGGQLATNDSSGNSSGGSNTAEPEIYQWSSIMPADSIESEVKRLNSVIDQVVTTPRKFESGGYRQARVHFSMLAVLFGIINEHDDQDIKWRDSSVAARELFSAMARNSTAGSSNVYQQAKLRKEDLRELVNGGSVDVAGDVDPENYWPAIVDHIPLMYRLEDGFEERLKPWVSSKSDVDANREELLTEAYMFAAIGELLMRDEMPFAEEDGYLEYAGDLKKAAMDVVEAVNANNYTKAAEAGSMIFQSCQNCHGEYP